MQKVLTLTVFCCLLFSCETGYKPYVPVYFTNEGLVERPDSLNPHLLKGIEHVFSSYGIAYRVENDKVYYKGDIDKEMMWNYTTKATDKEWLANHP